MAKQKRAKKKRIIVSADGSTARAPKTTVRLPVAFKVLDEVISMAMATTISTCADNPFEQFQVGIFQRAFNSIKAIRALLEAGHWEGATGLSRQLMEIVLSMEYIFLQSEDSEAEAFKFTRYGLLQQALYVRARGKYEAKVGRQIPDFASTVTDEWLNEHFADFKAGQNRDGSVRWAASWCGKSVYRLAQDSPSPGRIDQYELFYRAWSEQVHGTPGALMTSIFPVSGPEWFVQRLHEDDKRIAETMGNSIVLFFEIWQLLPKMRRGLTKEKAQTWIRQLQETQIGAWHER